MSCTVRTVSLTLALIAASLPSACARRAPRDASQRIHSLSAPTPDVALSFRYLGPAITVREFSYAVRLVNERGSFGVRGRDPADMSGPACSPCGLIGEVTQITQTIASGSSSGIVAPLLYLPLGQCGADRRACRLDPKPIPPGEYRVVVSGDYACHAATLQIPMTNDVTVDCELSPDARYRSEPFVAAPVGAATE